MADNGQLIIQYYCLLTIDGIAQHYEQVCLKYLFQTEIIAMRIKLGI